MDLPHAGGHLAVFVEARQRRHQPEIQRGLAAVGGDCQHVVFVRLDVAVADGFRPPDQRLHEGFQRRARRAGDDARLAAAQPRHRQVQHLRRADVGHFAEHRHQLGHVDEPGEARVHPIAAAVRRDLQRRDALAEGGGPGIELLQPELRQPVGLQVAHHGVDLGHGVGHRRRCCEHHAALRMPVELHRVARLQEQIEGALRTGQRQARHPRHLGEPVEVLVQVGLVHEQGVDTQQFPAEQVVLLLVGRQLFQPHRPVLLHRLELLDDPVGPVVALLGAYRHLYFMDDLLDESLAESRRHPDALEARVRDDHRVPIARGDARHQLAPAVAFQVLLARHQHRGVRIESDEFRRVLGQHVVGDHMAGLIGETQPAQLHAGDDAYRRLAGADHMEQPGVAGLHDAPHRIQLVRMQHEAAGESRQLQVRAIEAPGPRGVEQVVVDPAQLLAPFAIFEGPAGEPLLDQAQLLPRRQRLVGIDEILVGQRIAVAHGRHLHIERALHELDRVHARGAEFLGHLHVLPGFPLAVLHRPGAGFGRIAHLAVLEFQDLLDERLDIEGRNPHRPQARLDGRRWQVFRLHLFQRVDVVLIATPGQHRLLELRFHVA